MAHHHPTREDLPAVLLPSQRILFDDGHGNRIPHVLPSELRAPHPHVVHAAHLVLPQNRAQAMIREATTGQLDRLYGDVWAAPHSEHVWRIMVENRALPASVTMFVRHLLPALYEGLPLHNTMRTLANNYFIHKDMFLLTKTGRSSREIYDVYVPAPSHFVALLAHGNYILTSAQGSNLPKAALPAPLDVLSDNGIAQSTQGLVDFRRGDWNLNEKLRVIDSDAMSEWNIVPASARKVTWTFQGLEQSPRPEPPHLQPGISIWQLHVEYSDGMENKLRIHFDTRLMTIQHEYVHEFRATGRALPNGVDPYTVYARTWEERPVSRML